MQKNGKLKQLIKKPLLNTVHQMGRLFSRLILLMGLSISMVYAHMQSNPFELVVNTPVETHLPNPDLRDATAVWIDMFNQAKYQIDIAQFYVYNQPQSNLDKVLNALKQAGQRGVKIRFLLDKKGVGISNPETIKDIQAIPNLDFRIMDFSAIGQGIIHAKYIVVDQKTAFVGSQNFDWRALTHIHETGLKIDNQEIVKQISSIFQIDWFNQNAITQHQKIKTYTSHEQLKDPLIGRYLLASPPKVTPSSIYTAEDVFPQLIAAAKSNISIQVMQYSPLTFVEGKGKKEFYPLIDNSLRAAAARGVSIELLLADWNLKQPDIAWLKSLALVPNIKIKIVTIPKSKQGFIPFARVIHSKYMTIDDSTTWIGTSNWSGGYFDHSRNLEIVMNDVQLTQRVKQLYQQLWISPYAYDLDVNQEYKTVNPAKE